MEHHEQDNYSAHAERSTSSAQDRDMSEALCERVRQANTDRTPLRIAGGDTKTFYGRPVEGEILSLAEHRGITHYDPVELVISVRTGTPLSELEATLNAEGQQLGCEPPHFGQAATVGGMIATGLSGPRRPWAGSVRDFMLGTRVINHEGKHLRFGGEVMKNVAGYDLSRLMVGAQGTLGVVTEVSLKVLPKPTETRSLRLEMTLDSALERLAEWGRQPLPLSAAAWHDGALHLRLEGGRSSVAATAERLGGEALDATFWSDLREQRLAFFSQEDARPLWRLSLPNHTPPLTIDGDTLYDWAGAQRWVRSDAGAQALRDATTRAGGHATCFTPQSLGGAAEPFTPLAPVVAKYHRQLKAQLDPNGIFNPGRLYPEF
ncbi:glycolate oxidase subunit GlcE [Halomonas sp. McH1-25]|uniref:glycolate oxidase subunit GlcE n=1 Tax=unclassified Halomonas TaxID=2609666 RepID=UPI001EF47C1C|nr:MULTISPECIES: glycolate oxidase subunit GlcE [unclassified Halomonas]MCG7599250.1 glycolate oxidase subunit GlcE [Halomonas sp. McH1-25]MCP1341118.1 glycolate oxidase subunit GlcE [Halomonas sp. FL8]MCP1360288.1 glycolate oxidase subunit GlcE [Halomonas sp. BBD45]MCP1366133.1 glycolate oxidase subunit GlcE [Halomonas sp. BBD48]